MFVNMQSDVKYNPHWKFFSTFYIGNDETLVIVLLEAAAWVLLGTGDDTRSDKHLHHQGICLTCILDYYRLILDINID